MKRMAVAALASLALSTTALATEQHEKIDPAKKGPTETMSDQVPTMTSPAATDDKLIHPPTKAGDQAVSPGKPDDTTTVEKKPADSTTPPASTAN